jgi:plastocyanin
MKNLKNLAIAAALIFVSISAPAIAEEKATYELAIKDHKFTPEELKVPAGKPFILNVQNNDATAEEFESHSLKLEKIIAGNSSAKFHVKALKAGKYDFFGEFNEASAKGIIIAE